MSRISLIAFALLTSFISAGCLYAHELQKGKDGVPGGTAVAEHSYFFVGGRYAGETSRQVMHGQMYVEKLTPIHRSQRYPIVLIHGAGQTATNWMGTPDGRQGWAEFFCSQGYVVYLVEQPARGRSAWQEGIDGKLRSIDAQTAEKFFTAPELYRLWPEAKRHTQWPGDGPNRGQIGDPIFDQFYASQVPFLESNAESEGLVQRAAAALLDRIGPAILLTHSQSGPFGWLIADVRPQLVKAIIAIEPSGPPFENAVRDTNRARPWGLTETPITYDPPIADPVELQKEQQARPDKFGLVRCWLQKAPIHSLINLRKIKVMIVTAEASWHASYDHCNARYLIQAGVHTEFLNLATVGIHGNGHMMMLENNNLIIAQIITSWIHNNVT